VAYFNCFGSMITDNARCTHEIISRTVMEKKHHSARRRLLSLANWT
jgi:hypothetical protein